MNSENLLNLHRGYINQLDTDIEQLYEQAQVISKDYHQIWSAENKKVLNAKKMGSNDRTSNLAPFIRKHGANGKVYIYWALWPRNINKKAKKFPKQIPLTEGRYTMAQITKRAQHYEYGRVKLTERKLALIRESINTLHAMKVQHNATIRCLEKRVD